MGTPANFRVCELCDADGLPRYVYAAGVDSLPWWPIWERRAELPGELAAWFRTLTSPPQVRVFFDGLSAKTAHALVPFRLREINTLATGSPNEWADFVVNRRPLNPGKQGRPCVIIGADGVVREYPSVKAAAVAEGRHRQAVSRRIRQGRVERGGFIGI